MSKEVSKTSARDRVIATLKATRENLALIVPEFMENALERGQTMLEQAQEVKVTSKDSYDIALGAEKVIKQTKQDVAGIFSEPTELANSIHKYLTGKRGELLVPYDEAEKTIKGKRTKWFIEEERRAEERRRKEEERLRAKAEMARQKSIEILQRKGETEAAAEIADMDIVIPEVKTINRALTDGASFSRSYVAVIIDLQQVPREYMVPDMRSLTALAKARKGQNPPPGVEFREEIQARTRL